MWQTILKLDIPYEWIAYYDGRPILLADLGSEKVLFYIRTGSGGEPKEGQPDGGNFSPFFGFSYLNEGAYWWIKGYPDRYDKYSKEAKWLDTNVKDIPKKQSLSSLFEYNKLFKSKGATLGRKEYDARGFKVFFEPPMIMKNTIDMYAERKITRNLKEIEAEIDWWNKNPEKYDEELEAHEKTLTSMESLAQEWKSKKFKKADGRPIYDVGRDRLRKQVMIINEINKKYIDVWNEFMEVAKEWFDIDTEITYVESKYVEVSLGEVHQINKDRGEMR